MAVAWRRDYARYQKYFSDILSQYKKRPDLQIYLELILSLVTISAFALLALRPTFLTITALLTEIRTKEETIQKMDTKLAALATAGDILLRENTNIQLLSQAIPSAPAPERVTRQIEGVAKRNGVSLSGLSAGEITLVGKEPEATGRKKSEVEPLPEGASGVTISMNISGSYSSLVGFLNDVENLLRPLFIDSASISSVENQDQISIVLVLSGRSPYLKQQ